MAPSFLYPRRVAITRPNVNAGAGRVGYQGLSTPDETPIAAGLPASIQLSGPAGMGGQSLPSDPRANADWKVFVPRSALPKGVAKLRDVVTDDEGERYQIIAAYWNSMGHNLRCSKLQV